MRYFIVALLSLPFIEIAVFLLLGKSIGIPETLFFIILTGLIGAYLLKKQGLKAYKNVQEQLRFGQLPGDAILDGLCVLAGGFLLLLPGFLTDILGAVILLPPTRKIIKQLLIKWMQQKIHKNNRVKIIH
ncbi:FxsA family protein [Niallia sp. 01092]|uniref:FxsA family protein n=1 Tax=unclassified Niallia TaxID=2837522 RepID=UPI003FD165EB